ncbi:glutamate-cysteine ligase family protein [Caulobacter segnis]
MQGLHAQGRQSLGLDMMLRTCHGAGEPRLLQRSRHGRRSCASSLALQPIATALFANSPFTEGKPNGFLSRRAQRSGRDTDPNRTGLLDFVFEDGFDFERLRPTDALDVPMYFVKRGEKYIDVAGRSLSATSSRASLPELPGEIATMKDWADHTTTAFPEVRLKTYLEMRGADAGPWSRLCCACRRCGPACSTTMRPWPRPGTLCKDWTLEDREGLRRDVPRLGLKAKVAGRTAQDVAKDFVAIAKSGLKNRASERRLPGREPSIWVSWSRSPTAGSPPPRRLLSLYQGAWKGDIGRVFTDCAY